MTLSRFLRQPLPSPSENTNVRQLLENSVRNFVSRMLIARLVSCAARRKHMYRPSGGPT